MKTSPIVTVAAAALALALAAPVLAAQLDGKLPLYPRGHVAPGMESIPAAALAQGVPYQQFTTDSVHLVDLWYKSNAPKSCKRITAPGKNAVQYKCPSGSIVVQVHGHTLISFVPAFPHL